MSQYRNITKFGCNDLTPAENPLTYCINDTIDISFNHSPIGTLYGQSSKKCQAFMSDYCSTNWDEHCEFASKNVNKSYPNNLDRCEGKGDTACHDMTQGEILVHNTARKKYRTESLNCTMKCEQFDPTVYSSPLVCYEVGECCNTTNRTCIDRYRVDPAIIDQDPVMNKILVNPKIALTLLVNIYVTMKLDGSLPSLVATKLGRFYEHNKAYFDSKLKQK